jgi:FlaG/FlaF family flagellin (archaellin)
MEHKKFAVVILAAVIASLMLAGTILAPIQSYAAAKRGSETDFPDTSSLKHAVRDGVSANLSHRDQHLNQQNLCYRTNTCRQSDVGQNTQGNDNQVTGFADQSDNIQQAAPTNQTTNQTGGGGGGGSGTTSCVTLTISGLVSQTAPVQVCLIPDVVTLENITGIGPSFVVLSTDGCPRGFIDTQITVGRFHLCAAIGLVRAVA